MMANDVVDLCYFSSAATMEVADGPVRDFLLTRKQTTSRTDTVWPDMWKHVSDASKKKRRTIEKPKFDNAR